MLVRNFKYETQAGKISTALIKRVTPIESVNFLRATVRFKIGRSRASE